MNSFIEVKIVKMMRSLTFGSRKWWPGCRNEMLAVEKTEREQKTSRNFSARALGRILDECILHKEKLLLVGLYC